MPGSFYCNLSHNSCITPPRSHSFRQSEWTISESCSNVKCYNLWGTGNIRYYITSLGSSRNTYLVSKDPQLFLKQSWEFEKSPLTFYNRVDRGMLESCLTWKRRDADNKINGISHDQKIWQGMNLAVLQIFCIIWCWQNIKSWGGSRILLRRRCTTKKWHNKEYGYKEEGFWLGNNIMWTVENAYQMIQQTSVPNCHLHGVWH